MGTPTVSSSSTKKNSLINSSRRSTRILDSKSIWDNCTNESYSPRRRRNTLDCWTMANLMLSGWKQSEKTGKLYQKAEPHFKVSLDQVDYDYYVRNQIVPAAVRVLEVFGIAEKDLLGTRRGQASL